MLPSIHLLMPSTVLMRCLPCAMWRHCTLCPVQGRLYLGPQGTFNLGEEINSKLRVTQKIVQIIIMSNSRRWITSGQEYEAQLWEGNRKNSLMKWHVTLTETCKIKRRIDYSKSKRKCFPERKLFTVAETGNTSEPKWKRKVSRELGAK